MERKLEFSTRTERDTVIVDVAGQIDLGTSPALRKTVLESLKSTQRLAINMTRVEYIDSSGIASLVEVLKEGRKAGKRVMLFGVAGAVLQVLHLTRLTGVFEILETEAQVLDA
ncbi:MAG: STAS domain-containing protein [Terracidiphilus sp.]|jgi:anti-sigma B factor antagonist